MSLMLLYRSISLQSICLIDQHVHENYESTEALVNEKL